VNKKLWLLLLIILAGCTSRNKPIDDLVAPEPTATPIPSFDQRILTDTAGDVHPPFTDIVATRISQVEAGFMEVEFTANGDIPLSPDPSYGNIIYRIWVDSNDDTRFPAHGGGNAEYVLDIAYYNDVNANAWTGVIFDCALSTGETAFEVTIDGSTARARIPLSLIGNPASFWYSYQTISQSPEHDGDANAMMDQITLRYNIPVGQAGETLTPKNEPNRTVLPTFTLPHTPTTTATPATTCAGAYTRLKPNTWAIVTPGDNPNRVRAEPNTTAEVLTNIYPGTIVKILEGPVCEDGLVFWKVENNSIPGGVGWTAEGDGSEYWLEPYTYIPDSAQLSAYGVSFSVPGSWSNNPDAEIVPSGSDGLCSWPKYTKITLTTYPAQSDWKPTIYVYATDDKPDWYPVCSGVPMLKVHQQVLPYGERLLFGSTNARPIFNSDFLYFYKGKTSDGKYTLFTFLPVNFPLLAYSYQNPDLPLGGVPFNLNAQNWDPYYQAVGEQLEAAGDEEFTPSLSLLDLVVGSITVSPNH
jgi:hypothetical protein